MQLKSPYQLFKHTDIAPGALVLSMVGGVMTTCLVIAYDEDGDDIGLLCLEGDKKGNTQLFPHKQHLVLRLPAEVRLPTDPKAWGHSIPNGAKFFYALVNGEGHFVVVSNDQYYVVNTHTGLWSGFPSGAVFVNSWAIWTVEDEPRLLIES